MTTNSTTPTPDPLHSDRGFNPAVLADPNSFVHVDAQLKAAQRVILEIAVDIVKGDLPIDVSGFSDLHDHLDANSYVEFMVTDDDPDTYLDEINAVTDIVDSWLIRGVHRYLVGVAQGHYGLPLTHVLCESDTTAADVRSPICQSCGDEIDG